MHTFKVQATESRCQVVIQGASHPVKMSRWGSPVNSMRHCWASRETHLYHSSEDYAVAQHKLLFLMHAPLFCRFTVSCVYTFCAAFCIVIKVGCTHIVASHHGSLQHMTCSHMMSCLYIASFCLKAVVSLPLLYQFLIHHTKHMSTHDVNIYAYL